jgi:hypothetical protein
VSNNRCKINKCEIGKIMSYKKLYEAWREPSKTVKFKEDLEVKIKYSCTYRVYGWDELKQEKREEALEDLKKIKEGSLDKLLVYRPDAIYVEVNCIFDDYVPIARGIEPEKFNTMLGDDEYALTRVGGILLSYKVDVEQASPFEDWMIDTDDIESYINWKETHRGYEAPFLKGFSTHMKEFTEDISNEELDAKIKKQVKDLVTYFAAPQLKTGESLWNDVWSFEKIRPEDFLEIDVYRKMRLSEKEERMREKEDREREEINKILREELK